MEKIMFKVFMWIGKKLFTHKSIWPGGSVLVFHNLEKWSHKYGLSKWQMGIKTPKRLFSN